MRKKVAGMKKISAALLSSFLLCGCWQSSEHLVIEKDGSGTAEVHLMVPAGLRAIIDSMLGAMMDGMVKGMQGMAKEMGAPPKETPAMPASLSEEMFASKNEILKKADKAGLRVSFVSFDKNIRDNDLYVDYKLTYDDVNKLMRSGILSALFSLKNDDQGRMVFFLKKDPERARKEKDEIRRRLENTQTSGTSDSASNPQQQEMAAKFKEALSRFKIEFSVTLPNPLLETKGLFAKKDERTAYFMLSGNLLEDPALLDKMHGIDGVPEAVCSAEGLLFTPQPMSEEEWAARRTQPGTTPCPVEPAQAGSANLSSAQAGDAVTVSLKNGTVAKGALIEQTVDTVKIDCAGVPVTYFKEEIAGIEEDVKK